MIEPKNEAELEQQIKIDGPNYGCFLMRNNSGAFADSTGRVVRYGLGAVSKKHDDRIKSSDEIGFTRVTITPDMVGKTIAVFTAVEVKHPTWKFSPKDKREAAQLAFIDWVRANGGIAFFANSVDSFRMQMNLFRREIGAKKNV